MKKTMMYALFIGFTGLLLTNVGFAANGEVLFNKCVALENQLNNLFDTNPDDLCAPAVVSASSSVWLAGRLLLSGNNERAWLSLRKAERELMKIQGETDYCAYFSSRVQPMLSEVLILESEIEPEEFMR
jgi:hypothetical protein